jgi:Lon-like ATP-dependent protease
MNTNIFGMINLFFAIVIGLYFWNLLRAQQTSRWAVDKEAKRELERLERLRSISLSEPLSERTRPTKFQEIIGQADGVRALRAALCGPNPQHVLIYGPPGVGKTAAARLVLEEAKQNPSSPFRPQARFVELDATIARFDDRGIADPLIGSVHDPIYQGAGAMGMAGIPQPKPGAVTRAHGGILFLDEIGELHPIQLNKLLKVLEDRKVFLESAYYSPDDPSVPQYIHEIFQRGLPADFRLVGATTRLPEEISPAIRSRCLEIFFRGLAAPQIEKIAQNAAAKMELELGDQALSLMGEYAQNGREVVNMVQIASGLAFEEGRRSITAAHVEWVLNQGQYSPRLERKCNNTNQVGLVQGLALIGPNQGTLLEIEAIATPVAKGQGSVKVTGVVEEEETQGRGKTLRRNSMAKDSVANVLTVLENLYGLVPQDYNLHLNFPGGVPLDGPSAGVTIATAFFSALTGEAVRGSIAMTGELSIRGQVLPVGGVSAKLAAAQASGVRTVLIPKENWQESFAHLDLEVVAIERIEEVLQRVIIPQRLPQEVLA